jgi:hypothetical protein
MDEQTALHTAARRYCMERAPGLDPRQEEHWYRDRRWTQDQARFFTLVAARGTGAQLSVLGDILFRIEQTIPNHFTGIDTLRTFLIEMGRIVADKQTTSPDLDFEAEKEKERALFCRYIENLSVDDLHAVAPLPYRRVLGVPEQERIWQRLKQQWGLTPQLHWYPLSASIPPAHVVALQEDWFAQRVPPDVLRQILMQRRVRRVWELREAGSFPQYETDVALLVPWGGGGEHCWTSEKVDWILYTSHEQSVTIGGKWLLNLIKQAWPQWEEHIYTGPMYQRPSLEP